MRSIKLLGSLAAITVLLVPGAAHAQVFTNPNLKKKPETGKTESNARHLLLGSYGALWDFSSSLPGRTQVSFDDPLANIHTKFSARFKPDADPSALVTADYYITNNLSIGGWWNPFTGGIKFQQGAFNGTPFGSFTANYYDLHARYDIPSRFVSLLPRKVASGWSVQGGYSEINYNLHGGGSGLAPDGSTFFFAFNHGGVRTNHIGFSVKTANVWLNKTQSLGNAHIFGHAMPLGVFGSFGYQESDEFHNALNAIGGFTLKLTDRIDFSSSYWLNDFHDKNSRVSFGISTRY